MTTHFSLAADFPRRAMIWFVAASTLLVAATRASAGPQGYVDPQILKSEPAVLLKHLAVEAAKIPKEIGLWKNVIETDNDLNVRYQDTNYRVITFADAVLKDPRSQPEELQIALDAKLETLVRLWVYFGSKNLDSPQFFFDQHPGGPFYEELAKSERPFLARATAIQRLCAESVRIQATIANSKDLFGDREIPEAIAAELAKCGLVAKGAGDMSEKQFSLTMALLQFYEFTGAMYESKGRRDLLDQTVSIYRTLRDEGAAADNPSVRKLADDPELAARIRGLSLLGKRLEFGGNTRSGESFDFSKLRGKVVLLHLFRDDDQAATRLGGLKALERLRPHGLELVGVYLGIDADKLDKLLAETNVDWPVIFDAERAAAKKPQPFEEKYRLSRLPLNVLMAADGTVITFNAEGERLEKLLTAALAARAP
jgi:hypothetical protein